MNKTYTTAPTKERKKIRQHKQKSKPSERSGALPWQGKGKGVHCKLSEFLRVCFALWMYTLCLFHIARNKKVFFAVREIPFFYFPVSELLSGFSV